MASFNSVDLGPVVEMRTMDAPRERQVNAYPGVNGLEVLDMGGRGKVTEADGLCIASDPYGLASVEENFRTLQRDGGAYTLIDTLGGSWSGVILVAFQPIGRVMPLYYGTGGVCRKYHMEFLHVL